METLHFDRMSSHLQHSNYQVYQAVGPEASHHNEVVETAASFAQSCG
jgi:hypothetical protein